MLSLDERSSERLIRRVVRASRYATNTAKSRLDPSTHLPQDGTRQYPSRPTRVAVTHPVTRSTVLLDQ